METDRISQTHFSKGLNHKTGSTHMFLDDLAKGVMPIYRYRDKNIKISIEPENKEVEDLISNFLPNYPHQMTYNRNFIETVMHSVEFIAANLGYHGQLILEKIKVSEDGRETFHLIKVSGIKLKVLKDKVIQYYHDDIDDTSHQVEIPIEKCVVINFPDEFGGVKGYLEFLSKFEEHEKETPYYNFIRIPYDQILPEYNISEHQKLHDLEYRRISLPFNWHHRSFLGHDKLFSTYYWVRKRLLFKISVVKIRDYIVLELNNIITQFLKDQGYVGEIKYEGLLTVDEVEDKLRKWELGELRQGELDGVFY